MPSTGARKYRLCPSGLMEKLTVLGIAKISCAEYSGTDDPAACTVKVADALKIIVRAKVAAKSLFLRNFMFVLLI